MSLAYFLCVKYRSRELEGMESPESDKKLRKKVIPALCTVTFRSRSSSGILCVYKRGNTGEDDVYVLVAIHRILWDVTTSWLDSFILEFQPQANLNLIQIAQESIISAWNDAILDATIIEIKQGMAGRMMNEGVRFLEIVTPAVGNTAAIIVPQKGDEISFVYGEIGQYTREDQIAHRSSTKSSSFGSPLLTMEGKVVAIHRGTYCNESEAVILEFSLKLYLQKRNHSKDSRKPAIGILN